MISLRIESRGSFSNASQTLQLTNPSPTVTASGLGPGGLCWLEEGAMRLRKDTSSKRSIGATSVHRPAPTVLSHPSQSDHWTLEGAEAPSARRGDKPPYEVPLMSTLLDPGAGAPVVASTFAGAGGSCTGYRMAGYRVAWASEFEPNAAQCYAANHPSTVLDTRDVRTVSGAEIVAAAGTEIDLLDGSPPCQAFSTAGQRSGSWGRVMDHADGTRQRSDDLFPEYIRLVGEIRPRVFVAENVSGLASGVSKGMFKRYMAALGECGYVVRARLLDAQWLGVPQFRQRVFIVGVRCDLGAQPRFPVPLRYRYSILDACPHLATERLEVRQGGWADFVRHDMTEPLPTVVASQSRARLSASTSRARRLRIDEVKALCSFPADYRLAGTYAQQWARLGNAVPPLMARAVGAALRPVLSAT